MHTNYYYDDGYIMSTHTRLIVLTLLLIGIYIFFHTSLNPEERKLYGKLLSAQKYLWSELGRRGLERNEDFDPYHSGFIGEEYSAITTTMGNLAAKQCSTNPLWAVQFMRWFTGLGLKSGDRVYISASSSFPAMVYSCIAASESLGLDVVLCVSLGSSTWGANRPEFPLSAILASLRSAGFMNVRPSIYTLGGENENAGNMSEEGRDILIDAVKGEELIMGKSLQEIIDIKAKYLEGSKVFVNIGGNASSMGMDSMSLNIPAGLVMPDENIDGGNGLAGIALRQGVPVIHVLNLKGLADRCGIDFEARHADFRRGRNILGSIAGFALFTFFMITHRRWGYEC